MRSEAEAAASQLLAPGVILAERYQVLKLIGQGGMGQVYAARHLALGRLVALKVLRDPGDEGLRRRFFREAQLASRIQHPYLVYVIDFGSADDGLLFLAMELVSGSTLREVLAKVGPLQPLRVCRIGAMIARGMQCVHDQGIVHRDLKPANIFLIDAAGPTEVVGTDSARGAGAADCREAADFVKIVDFGVAREACSVERAEETQDSGPQPLPPGKGPELAPTLSRAGALIGTPRYMAPEQIRGAPADARTDQYALGCILYELLTGVPPFGGDLARTIRGHLYEEAPAPSRLQPRAGIPAALEAAVQRALARRRESRFPAMRELAQTLDAIASDLQSQQEKARCRPSGQGPGAGRRSGLPRRPELRRHLPLALLAAVTLAAGSRALQRDRSGAPQRSDPEHAQALLPPGHGPPSATNLTVEPSHAGRQSDAPAASVSSRDTRPRSDRPPRHPAGPPAGSTSLAAELERAEVLAEREPNAAQQILQGLRQRCLQDTRLAKECRAIAPQVALEQGKLYEQDGQWAEALQQYEWALAHDQRPELHRAAQRSVDRLAPRLGSIVVLGWQDSRCTEATLRVPPGTHQVEVNGVLQQVTVRALQTVRLGTCL